ncbi:MAG: cache and HAMP domain-containing protein, partial [Eubacterium sp.]|nr:cache and HAMP domain-containing protein [Eubacterium sp.]
MKRKDDIDELLEVEEMAEKEEKKGKKKKKKKSGGAKISIFVKILLVALLCMAIPLIIVVMYSNNKNGNTINDTAASSLRSLSTAQSDALDQFITAQKGIVCSIANNGQIVGICRDTEDATQVDSAERDKMSEYLLKIAETEGNIYENIFFTCGSQTYANTVGNMEETLINVEGQEFYETCLTEGSFFGTDVSPGSGLPVYVIAYAITDPSTGDVVGVVNAAISLSAMSQNIVSNEEGSDTSVTLLDLSGNVVANPDETLILNYNVAESDPETWETITTNAVGDMPFSNDITGGVVNVMGYTVGSNYVCMVYTPGTVFSKPVNAISRQMSIIAVIAIILAGIVIAFATRTIVKPLMKSTNVVNGLIKDIESGGGNLNTQVDITTHDEVGELGGSINQFISTLKDVMTMLKSESDKLTEV